MGRGFKQGTQDMAARRNLLQGYHRLLDSVCLEEKLSGRWQPGLDKLAAALLTTRFQAPALANTCPINTHPCCQLLCDSSNRHTSLLQTA